MKESRDEVEIHTPWGWRGFFRGNQVICALVLCLVAALVIYLDDRSVRKLDSMISAQASIIREMKENTEAQNVIIYLLSLSQAEREKLNLLRPKKLAEMQR